MSELKLSRYRTNRIRPFIILFIAFEMTMLFQTSYSNMGTVVTGVLSLLIIFTCLIDSFRVKIDSISKPLIIYVIIVMFTTFIYDGFSSGLFHLLVYTLLFILLSSIEIHERESRWLIRAYVFTSVVYSVLILAFRVGSTAANIHSRIEIFGSRLDPNYIGLPLVVSFSIVMYQFLFEKRSFLKLMVLLLVAIAIILTSSRGNFLSMSVCGVFCVLIYLSKGRAKWYTKTFVIFVLILMIIAFYYFASDNYGLYLQRIIHFSNDDVSNGRFRLWGNAISVWLEHPLLGSGFEALARRINAGVHNTFVQLLCDSGIVGFVAFSLFVIRITKKSFRYNRCMYICLIGVVCHSFFLGAMTSRSFWVTLIMVNMILSGYKTKKNQSIIDVSSVSSN